MKKTLVVSILAVVGFGSTAVAQNYQQYISGKGSIISLENKLTGSVVVSDQVRNPGIVSSAFLNQKKSDTVGGFRLAYGLLFPIGNNTVRTEIEYGYNGKGKLNDGFSLDLKSQTENYIYKSHVKTQFIMANVYYDFNTGTKLTPYVGVGLGWARLKAENSIDDRLTKAKYQLSRSKNNFAWNLTAGVAYKVNRNLAVDFSYRYADYGKTSNSGSYKMMDYKDEANFNSKIRANEFNLGFRYTF